jgi:hypothetical protein
MTAPLDRLARNYTPAFLAFVRHPDEQNRHRAYELGRDALADGISLLDLIRTHHTVFGHLLAGTAADDDLADMADGAASFLVEALAPYEMARRGFLDRATPPRAGSAE